MRRTSNILMQWQITATVQNHWGQWWKQPRFGVLWVGHYAGTWIERPRSISVTSMALFVGPSTMLARRSPCAYWTPCLGVYTHTHRPGISRAAAKGAWLAQAEAQYLVFRVTTILASCRRWGLGLLSSREAWVLASCCRRVRLGSWPLVVAWGLGPGLLSSRGPGLFSSLMLGSWPPAVVVSGLGPGLL